MSALSQLAFRRPTRSSEQIVPDGGSCPRWCKSVNIVGTAKRLHYAAKSPGKKPVFAPPAGLLLFELAVQRCSADAEDSTSLGLVAANHTELYWSSDFCASPLRPQQPVNSRVMVDLEVSLFETLRWPKHPRSPCPRAGPSTSSRPCCTSSRWLSTPRPTREAGLPTAQTRGSA